MVRRNRTRMRRRQVEMGWTLTGGVVGIVGSLAFTFWLDVPAWVVQMAGPLQIASVALLAHWFSSTNVCRPVLCRKWFCNLLGALAVVSAALFSISWGFPGAVKWIIETICGWAFAVWFSSIEMAYSK